MSASTPIACTLKPGEFMDRLAWIADLNTSALRSHRLSGLELELIYARHAAERVRELVRREERCCAFLRFTVREEAEIVRLTIEAPEAVREGVAALVAPFLTTNGRDTARSSGRATFLAIAAVAGLVCCVLPFALSAAALTALGSAAALARGAHWWAVGLVVAGTAIGLAWVGARLRFRSADGASRSSDGAADRF